MRRSVNTLNSTMSNTQQVLKKLRERKSQMRDKENRKENSSNIKRKNSEYEPKTSIRQLKREPSTMSTKEFREDSVQINDTFNIHTILCSLGLQMHEDKFIKNKISPIDFFLLTREDLVEMELPIKARNRVLAYLSFMKQSRRIISQDKVLFSIISNQYGDSIAVALDKPNFENVTEKAHQSNTSHNTSIQTLQYKNEHQQHNKSQMENEPKHKSVLDAVNSVMQELDDLKRQKSISKSPTLTNPLDDDGGDDIQMEKRDFEEEYSNSIQNE